MDGNKGTLTVVGDVEPVPIFKALKKIGETPEIVSVGPPKPQRCQPYCYCGSCQSYSYSDQQQKWWDPLKPSCPLPCNRSWCNQCELVAVEYPSAYDSGQCSIQWVLPLMLISSLQNFFILPFPFLVLSEWDWDSWSSCIYCEFLFMVLSWYEGISQCLRLSVDFRQQDYHIIPIITSPYKLLQPQTNPHFLR